jgi:predicted nuclease of restriction endonuclease-like (RecB) superfamily
MRQFYETYADNEKLAPLVREISWTQNLIIMSRAKTEEAREFYLLLCSRNNYTKRELERQIDSLIFERTMISDERNKLFLSKNPGLVALRDSYVLEFLDVPEGHKEKELRKSIVANLRDFILEFGKDFTFVGEEYRVQVGNKDFHIDLLFYNRELSCLVAIELKVTDFRPEYLGQIEFYLEALDRDVRKPNENPSVGLILCAGKDDAVVEYALSRSMSPALVADYQLHLPNKALLENKLRELTEYAETSDSFEDESESTNPKE